MVMNCNSLVTVIVPIYNAEKYLDRCLDSIVSQTYRNLEILLINDGSTDDSEEICRRYMNRDSRIRLFCQENHGQSAARNVGLDHMRGEYLTFVDADDYIERSYVEMLINELIKYEVPLAVCGFDMPGVTEARQDAMDIVGTGYTSHIYSRNQVYNTLRHWHTSACFILLWGKLYVRDIFMTLRFPDGKICEDEAVFHRIYDQVEHVCYVDIKLYHYVQSPNSTMRRDGLHQFNKDGAEAFVQRLEYFQGYGQRKYIRMTAMRLLMITKSLCEQSGATNHQLQEEMRAAMDKIRQITGRGIFSARYILCIWFPALYRFMRRCKRKILH